MASLKRSEMSEFSKMQELPEVLEASECSKDQFNHIAPLLRDHFKTAKPIDIARKLIGVKFAKRSQRISLASGAKICSLEHLRARLIQSYSPSYT
jgi:hypothetical protein